MPRWRGGATRPAGSHGSAPPARRANLPPCARVRPSRRCPLRPAAGRRRGPHARPMAGGCRCRRLTNTSCPPTLAEAGLPAGPAAPLAGWLAGWLVPAHEGWLPDSPSGSRPAESACLCRDAAFQPTHDVCCPLPTDATPSPPDTTPDTNPCNQTHQQVGQGALPDRPAQPCGHPPGPARHLAQQGHPPRRSECDDRPWCSCERRLNPKP